MPSTVVQSFAKRTGKSAAEVEKLWNQAKAQVTKEYKIKEPTGGQDGGRFYKLVVGILKRMLKINDGTEPAKPVVGTDVLNELRRLGFKDVATKLEGK